MTRRFEFVAGNSAKFWELTVHRAVLTIRFGRLGTDGQTQTKTFPTADLALVQAKKLIVQKTRKGYSECVIR